jgi:5'-phosphate synthase pdxT subunit
VIVGVLALQGGWRAHLEALERAGLAGAPVRDAGALAGCGGLVLPGGESSAMLRLIDRAGLWGPLDDFVRAGRPTLATCAGLILAAAEVVNPRQRSFGWLDVTAQRNGWGRQLESFVDADRVFIRAPRITRVGPGVQTLDRCRGEPVVVRQGALVAATCHPELGADRGLYRELFADR